LFDTKYYRVTNIIRKRLIGEGLTIFNRRFPVDFAKAGIDANFIFVKLNERLGF